MAILWFTFSKNFQKRVMGMLWFGENPISSAVKISSRASIFGFKKLKTNPFAGTGPDRRVAKQHQKKSAPAQWRPSSAGLSSLLG